MSGPANEQRDKALAKAEAERDKWMKHAQECDAEKIQMASAWATDLGPLRDRASKAEAERDRLRAENLCLLSDLRTVQFAELQHQEALEEVKQLRAELSPPQIEIPSGCDTSITVDLPFKKTPSWTIDHTHSHKGLCKCGKCGNSAFLHVTNADDGTETRWCVDCAPPKYAESVAQTKAHMKWLERWEVEMKRRVAEKAIIPTWRVPAFSAFMDAWKAAKEFLNDL